MVLSEEIKQLNQELFEKSQKNLEKISQDSKTDINKNLLLQSEPLKLPSDIEKLKQEDNKFEECRKKEENSKTLRDLENSETAHIIEEIIEGISLQGRRGTLVRTISAVLR